MRAVLEACACVIAIIGTLLVFFAFLWCLGQMFSEPTPKPEPDGSIHICVNAKGEITEGEDWRECMTVDYFRR